MTTAAANPPFLESDDPSLKKFLVYSLVLHGSLALAIAISIYFQYHGNQWGGVGGGSEGAKVNLVSSAGIPMPKEPVVTESQVVDPTKGLFKEEPPKPPEPKTDATKIPEFKKEKPLPPTHKSKTFENKTPPPENAVPYGKGGNPDLPTGYSQTPGGASSGVAMQGPEGGDFASRYGWYVAAVVRRLQAAWQQNTIDASVRSAHRAKTTVTFTILRDGSVKDIRIAQGSGNTSMDNSGLRAVLGSNPMPALPSDFNGSKVDVTFDFDLSLSK
jgi:TonB family protein